MVQTDVENLIRFIEANKIDITCKSSDDDTNYSVWLKVCFSLISLYGAGARDYFQRLSQFFPKYNPKETDTQFDKCLKDGSKKITIASFFWVAANHGIDISLYKSSDENDSELNPQSPTPNSQSPTPNPQPHYPTPNPQSLTPNTQLPAPVSLLPTPKDIESYLNQNYDFRFNEITGRTEFKTKNEDKFIVMDDFNVNSIQRELTQNKIKCSVTGLRNKFCSDFCEKYNPIKNYFESLSI